MRHVRGAAMTAFAEAPVLDTTRIRDGEVADEVLNSAEIDLWLYRTRTVALLQRYARTSVETGRLPSLLGREFFRSRVTSYSMKNFEDAIVFVTDMERSLEKLTDFDKKLLAMNLLEEYTICEMANLLQCSQRSIERFLQQAIDEFSLILLNNGLLHELHNQ
jgi:DNA-directed RNA polymerase specialized sigma24 family protein